MTTTRITLAAAGGLAIALALTGCANPIEQLVQGGVESVIEQQTGSDIDVSGDGNASVPDDFPSSIPILDGDVFFSQSIEGNWMLDMYVDSEDEALSGYQQLLDAGFAEIAQLDLGELKSNVVDNDQFSVSYVYGQLDDENRMMVKYTVTTKTQ